MKLNSKTKQGQKGAAAIEYALLASLIALAIIVAVTAMSGQLSTVFDKVRTALGG
ncbi:MAG: Flp family type IVb pilin [Candidatus Omnitrophica bacterium]|nr:Flp family type IVb pilin [Candidatus Omnitrophota bacterium]